MLHRAISTCAFRTRSTTLIAYVVVWNFKAVESFKQILDRRTFLHAQSTAFAKYPHAMQNIRMSENKSRATATSRTQCARIESNAESILVAHTAKKTETSTDLHYHVAKRYCPFRKRGSRFGSHSFLCGWLHNERRVTCVVIQMIVFGLCFQCVLLQAKLRLFQMAWCDDDKPQFIYIIRVWVNKIRFSTKSVV